jgi:hypothetical protein
MIMIVPTGASTLISRTLCKKKEERKTYIGFQHENHGAIIIFPSGGFYVFF